MTSDRTPIALWVVPVADLGGVARHVLDTTRVGIPGWRVVVLCPAGPLVDRLRAQGTAVVARAFGPDAGFLVSRRALARTARALRPAIVHSHLAYADIVNAWTRLPAGTRRLTTEHGIAGDDRMYHASKLKSRAMAMVHRARFHRFSGVIAVSRATRVAMIRKWKVRQPIDVIVNGVDLPEGVARREPGSVTGLRILSLSRLAPEKRIDRLIDAFAVLRRSHPEATLAIAGDGPLLTSLRDQARRLGVGQGVAFPGFIEPDAAMERTDVVVQLSDWENCSYTLLDAAARGLRVVASDVGGNPEILSPAALVASGDIASVARALTQTEVAANPIPGSIREMCRSIADVYSDSSAAGGRSHPTGVNGERTLYPLNPRRAVQRVKHDAFVQQKRFRLWWRYQGRVAIDDWRWSIAEARRPFVYNADRYTHTFLAQQTPIADIQEAPSLLWAIWLGGELTAPRKTALHVLHAMPGLEFRLVTDPGEVLLEGHPFHPAFDRLALLHKSDYLRAYVMHHFGGVYADVKTFTHSLRPVLERVNSDPDLWVGAYREITSNYVPELGYALGEDLKRHFRSVMGPSAFAFRPQSPFTIEWMRELTARMDYYAHTLGTVDMNERGPYDRPSEYPIRWSELAADIIQPLSLKHGQHVFFTDSIRPVLKNFR